MDDKLRPCIAEDYSCRHCTGPKSSIQSFKFESIGDVVVYGVNMYAFDPVQKITTKVSTPVAFPKTLECEKLTTYGRLYVRIGAYYILGGRLGWKQINVLNPGPQN